MWSGLAQLTKILLGLRLLGRCGLPAWLMHGIPNHEYLHDPSQPTAAFGWKLAVARTAGRPHLLVTSCRPICFVVDIVLPHEVLNGLSCAIATVFLLAHSVPHKPPHAIKSPSVHTHAPAKVG